MQLEVSVGEFVALMNQTLEYAYSSIIVVGELANFRVSKNRWVYFDLKDEEAVLKCFGTVYQLTGGLEDGMLLKVRGTPRLHPRYGFSLNIFSVQPAGEGAIKKAAELLEAKLAQEGLFAPERKRPLNYPPAKIGLIASSQSAAYADFIKILGARWQGVDIVLADVLVQGDEAPTQIIEALDHFNQLSEPPEVVVLTRGGGSPEELAVFSDERVVRAVSASRIPTLVAIGHESDVSLAELAADKRASTPSNAAELLVPDKTDVKRQIKQANKQLYELVDTQLTSAQDFYVSARSNLVQLATSRIAASSQKLAMERQMLSLLNPGLPLERGYALVRNSQGGLVRRGSDIGIDDNITIEVSDADINAKVEGINAKE